MWAFDHLLNAKKQHLFTPQEVTGTIHCSGDFPHVLMFTCNLPRSTYSLHQVENAVRKFLRAPWELFHFTLAQTENSEIKFSDARPVPETKADGNPITTDDFRNFILTHERNTGTNITQEALSKKPDIFLADRPTWTDIDGNTRSTNFFEDYFRGWDGIKVPIAALYRNNNLSLPHREKMVRIQIKPYCIVTHPGDDTFYSYDISYEWGFHDFYQQTTNLTYSSGSGTWAIEAAGVDDAFDTRVRNFADFYTKFLQRGLNIPFDMSLLPQTRGYDTIRFEVEFMFEFGSLHRQRLVRHMTFKIDPDARLCNLTTSMLDFSPYKNFGHKFINNGCAMLHGDILRNTTNRPPPTILRMQSYIAQTFQLLKAYFHEKKIDAFPTLQNDLDKFEKDLKQASKLLMALNNKNWEQSEGYLQLKEVWGSINLYLQDLHQGGFTSVEQLGEIDTYRNQVDLSSADVVARHVGIIQDVHSQTKRPLHEEKTRENESIDRQHADTIEQNLRPRMPLWGEIVLMMLATTVFVVFMYVIYKMKK